ncbi:hypothetical protein [Desulfobacter vibrioformis]|uniref:hypothetical protein n=1 Tax=Desulfobacter vibrioformis TaxID=34031 RepID=UPI00069168B7|nr:hypothetical protein [Desulfobacter vibrioformis]
METDLINLMFTQFKDNLSSFISNDISVILLAMLSLMFTVFAFVKIREIFNFGMTEEEIDAKNAFNRWQYSKGTWREQLMREEYQASLDAIRDPYLGEPYYGGYDDSEVRIKSQYHDPEYFTSNRRGGF